MARRAGAEGLTAGLFRLEPLGPRHNAADYAAWTASTGHIRATPGFAGTGWPHPMSLADNRRDLERRAHNRPDQLRLPADPGRTPKLRIGAGEALFALRPPRQAA